MQQRQANPGADLDSIDPNGPADGGARSGERRAASVVQALEADIIFGALKPNDRLVEDALMARYGAKRHVVRQAFAQLEGLGIVRREPNKGARIRAFSKKEVGDIYDMRALLQGHAAAKLPMPGPASLLTTLDAIHRDHSAAVDAGRLREVYHLNNAFHDAIFGACGNDYLADEIRRYATLAHAIRSYRIGDPDLLRQARGEHAEMIEALAAGDRVRFVTLCVEHIQPSRRAYLAATASGAGDGA